MNPVDWQELARLATMWTGARGKQRWPEAEAQRYRDAYLARLSPPARRRFLAIWGSR